MALSTRLSPARSGQGLLWLLLAVLLMILAVVGRRALRGESVLTAGPGFGPAAALTPTFEGNDERRQRIAIELEPIARGIEQPTDIQFPDGMPGYAVVLSKTGTAHWLRLDDGAHGELFKVDVLTASEEGLLGIAFHPKSKSNRRFFINYVAAVDGKDTSRVAEWHMGDAKELPKAKPKAVRVLMDVEQPYPNHDAGQLAFGPDGYLYIGWGDGGAGGDPHGHGQNAQTLLGSMLRIDIDAPAEGGKPYAVPKDNPFLGKPGFAPETWAYGLRNPWRYSFDPKGRLILADVGQNRWEEIDILRAGDNLGWAIKEGFECFAKPEQCAARKDLVDPVLVYGREDGVSITGGYVYTGKRVKALSGLYVFGDFGSGRLFALRLPDDRSQRVKEPIALGRFSLAPAALGRDPEGELYVTDFARGIVYRVAPAE